MKISNGVLHVNYNNSNLNFKGLNKVHLPQNQTTGSVKNGHKSSILALALLFFGGIAALQGLSSGAFESSIKDAKEKFENLIYNIKEQNRIDKLPDGIDKEYQQKLFDLKKEIEKGW